jgi:proliferating cell nuclear antigen
MNIEIKNLQKADVFVSCFQHMKLFTDHVNIIFDTHQMYVQCVDSSTIVIFEIVLPSDWFDVYQLPEDEKVVVGLNASLFFKVLNTREKSQTILIQNSQEDHLSVDFLNASSEDAKFLFHKHFEIPLLDIETDLLEIPPIDYQAEMTLPSGIFAGLITQLKQFGDNLLFECSEEKISLVASSSEQGKMYADISIEDMDEFAIEEGQSLQICFSLRYLQNVCSYQKMSKDITIGISEQMPMRIQYRITMDERPATMTFYLAPRMDD